jgi:TIR domain
MSGKIFLNYRRSDAEAWADRVYERLTAQFARDDVFMDIDGRVPLGRPWATWLDSQVAACDVMLVLIGGNWVAGFEARSGPEARDYVRVEIERALARDIPVVPVFLGDVAVPSPASLPASIRPLIDLQAIRLQRGSFDTDVKALIDGVVRSIALARCEIETSASVPVQQPHGASREKHYYKYDVYISYSPLDDRSPSNESGAVTAFRDALSILLSQRLGRIASIWHDSRLSGQDVLDDTIREALQNTAVLVVLYSAGYASSEYCAKEREWFARRPLKIGDQSRVLTVRLTNIPYRSWPKELQGTRGFDFFSVDPANDPIGYPLRPKDSAFDRRVQEVAVGIEAVLDALRSDV